MWSCSSDEAMTEESENSLEQTINFKTLDINSIPIDFISTKTVEIEGKVDILSKTTCVANGKVNYTGPMSAVQVGVYEDGSFVNVNTLQNGGTFSFNYDSDKEYSFLVFPNGNSTGAVIHFIIGPLADPAGASQLFVFNGGGAHATGVVELLCNATSDCIDSFPYNESFETGLGDWINATGDDLDWTQNSGSTPSSGTGPSAAKAGTEYLYIEASGSNTSNKTAVLESPCIDLTGLSHPTNHVQFNYNWHMYGFSMGSLKLEVSTDDGATWNQVWQKSGDQGNVWDGVGLSLGNWLGQTIKLRFVGTTGNGFASDIALDNFRFVQSY